MKPGIEQIVQVLLREYPTYDDFFDMMWRGNLTPPQHGNKSLPTLVEEIVQTAGEQGWLATLLRAAGVAMPTHDGEPARERDLRVGFITMKDEELDAVLARMPGSLLTDVEGRFYYRARVQRAQRRALDLIAMKSLTQGNLSATNAARAMISSWAPDYVFLFGIAGAIHPDIRVGDVAVGEQIFYYEMAKVSAGQTMSRTIAWNLSARLRSAADAASRLPWAESAKSHRPDTAPSEPRMLLCPVGSGDKLIADADADEIRRLRTVNNKIAALEMEAAGVASALHEQGQSDRLIVVRGISDHADAAKDDRFQSYASHTAAAFSFALLGLL